MLFTIRTPEEWDMVREIEHNALSVWNAKFESTMDQLVEHNKYYQQNQVGMGASKGNSGEGIVEARFPLHFILLALRGTPDLLVDDKKWYSFLRKNKEFRAYKYGR